MPPSTPADSTEREVLSQVGEFPDGSILSGLADLKLSRGPMVTSGVAFYF